MADTREVVVLESGVRIVFDEMPGLRTAAVGVFVGAGARDEPVERNGLAHFHEHMAFKGARGMNAREIAEAVEGRGASVNAATEYERTSYFVRCLAADAPAMVEILLAMIFKSDHVVDEIEREKGVVLQEIGEA
ncbi:MAG TPA: insulinase family protein, partial [Hyphomonadaceae bacterium]|nr:insulinase family protein [Hyphomonadaceae bacterium]